MGHELKGVAMSSLVRPLVSSLRRSLKGRGLDALNALIAQIFSANEQGAFYVPKPIVNGTQALFQDSAGTVPVTADGDPVGKMLDQSGNGKHATQSTSAARPIYRTNGTLHWLEFDGVDDLLTTVSVAAWAISATMWVGVSSNLYGTNEPVIILSGGASGSRLYPNDSAGESIRYRWVSSNINEGGGSSITAPQVVAASVRSGSQVIYRNGSIVGSYAVVATPDTEVISIGGSASSGQFSSANVYAAVLVEGDRTGVMQRVTEYTATLAGVTISPLTLLINRLFDGGQQGAFYVSQPTVRGVQALFQNAAGSTAVTADGDPSGRMVDQSPNAHAAVQSTSAARPTYNASPDRLSLDKVDDALIITVPTGGWNGTMVLATDDGTASYGISIPAGAYELGGEYFPGEAIVGALFRDGALTASEKSDAESYFVGNGAGVDYSEVTSFNEYWRDRSEIIEFPLIDTSSGTSFYAAWRDCSSLTSFPLIDTSSGTSFYSAWLNCTSLTSFPPIDTSSGTSFSRAWSYCTSLTSFPLIDTSSGTDFYRAWRNCTSLTSFPPIDTSSGTRFILAWYRCTSLTSFPLIDTSSGTNFNQAWSGCTSLTSFPANAFDNIKGGDFTLAFTNTNLSEASIDGILVSLVTSGIAAGTRLFDQSGGSAPSSTGEAAIDTLRSRGWTVAVTGGY